MKIAHKLLNDKVIFSPKGEITIQTLELLREKMTPFIEKDIKYILIDMGGVKYIDSAGLSLLIEEHKALEKRGKSLVITNLGGNVAKVIEITKLTKLFRIYSSNEDAFSALK